MKKLGILLPVIVLLLVFSAQVLPQDEEYEEKDAGLKYEIKAYNDHLYKISYESDFYPFNVFVSVGEDGILLVDTGLPNDVEGLETAIRSISDKPIKLILVTHTHIDHIGGVAQLGKEAKIVVNERGVEARFHALEPVQNFSYPVMAVQDSLTIQFNGDAIHLYNLPPGHDSDELYVYFEQSGVVCIGSRVIPSSYPYADLNAGCSVDELINRVKIFAEMYPEVIFATGHREDQNAEQLLAYHKALTENVKVIIDGFEAGKTAEDLINENALAPWDSLADYGVTHQLWINLIARGKGFIEPPAESVAKPMTEIYMELGIDASLEHYRMLKAEHPGEYAISEREINLFGYQLLYRSKFEDAKRIFELNIEEYPNSANVYDSYGEVLLILGDTLKAVENYRKALEVDSTFQNAKAVLKNLEFKL